jgi:DNA repair protein RadC
MGLLEREQLRVLLLDTRNRLIEMVILYQGSVNCAQVRVAEVFQAAIQRNARSILLAHNHPSSDLSPSPEDVALTRAVVQAGNLLDISVVDHLVIGKSGFVSLRERGLGFS